MENAMVILEATGGAHNLGLGDYFYDKISHIIYVGIGDFAPGSGVPVGVIQITENGTYDISRYAQAIVNVVSNLGTKKITANGTYSAVFDGLDGYNIVEVDVPITPIVTLGAQCKASLTGRVSVSAGVEVVS